MRNRIRVVIADDEGMIRNGMERLVTSHGEEWDVVGTFKNGKELLDCCSGTNLQFDLLITDVKMPVMDGLALIKELKKSAAFEAIVISGFDDFAYLQTAMREGAVDYIVKPIDRDELFTQLSNVKERIEQKRERQRQLETMKQQAFDLAYAAQTKYFNQIIWRQEGIRTDWREYGFQNGAYMMMYITPDQTLPDLHYSSKLEEQLSAWSRMHELLYWICEGEQQSYWLLVYSGQNDARFEEVFRLFAKEIKRTLKAYTSISFSIAISPIVHDLDLLPNIKRDLQALMQFRLVYGGDRIFEEHSIHSHQQPSASAEPLEELVQHLVTSIERLHVQEVEKSLHVLFDTLKTLPSPKDIETVIQSLSIQVLYFTMKAIPLEDDTGFNQTGLLLSKGATTLSELKEKVSAWVMEVMEHLSIAYKEQNTDQLMLAKRWMQAHLHENITIERIAKEIYMNPTYFCELFKNQTGETVLDYITKARMQKAQELLLRTDLKVYEIAQRVGYSDTKYFSKLFKKHYGELPSKYKESKIT